ncbi:MAG: cysteine--tRNA ligase [Clostridia bacterium]|nr:cysteine--tRNA ligase [Clostridia bacterium]
MGLKIYNTFTRNKEDFKPITEGNIGMYVCGPTVYGPPHVGHARSYIVFDTWYRYFLYKGFKVKYVQNITDVGHLVGDADEGEDKIQKKAITEQLDPVAVAYKYETMYFDCMHELNVLKPTISCRATGHIIEIIEAVKELVEKGYAYVTKEGNVYYDVRKFKEYGKLSGRTLDDNISGERIEVADDKQNPEDFALWKKADRTHLMKWPSPWGEGYPGWHIECSVMSRKYLGDTFDIHGGGMDNVFPHHECEIAQSEAITGKPFVNYFVHNNLITVNGQKMGKSLGNTVDLNDLFEKYGPMFVRLYIVKNHYRSVLDFSEDQLEETKKTYEKFQNLVEITEPYIVEANSVRHTLNITESYDDIDAMKNRFLEAMDDDLNTAVGIAVLLELAKEANKAKEQDTNKLAYIRKVFDELAGDILGLQFEVKNDSSPNANMEKLEKSIIDIRNEFKKNKQYEIADFIRDTLKENGINMIDTKEGAKLEF